MHGVGDVGGSNGWGIETGESSPTSELLAGGPIVSGIVIGIFTASTSFTSSFSFWSSSSLWKEFAGDSGECGLDGFILLEGTSSVSCTASFTPLSAPISFVTCSLEPAEAGELGVGASWSCREGSGELGSEESEELISFSTVSGPFVFGPLFSANSWLLPSVDSVLRTSLASVHSACSVSMDSVLRTSPALVHSAFSVSMSETS
mmetsp:Transcript_1869/g.2917  ORF Transcript_1869/g.2917 Transcript_1869/m.2917 type:complete len:204 (-) Transcript_1869:313-924(-)